MKKFLTLCALCAISSGVSGDVSPSDNIRLALNMYSNQRAKEVGDLVVVTIEESSSSNKSENLKTSKEAVASANMPYFGTSTQNPSNIFQRFRNSVITNSEQSVPFNEYTVQASSSFNGSGSGASSDEVKSEFACMVTGMLENGVLVIRGERKLLYRNEVVSLVVTGLIRSRDIDNNNKISSTKVAEAHIYYETGGEISRGSRPGYGWRFFQIFNPF